MIYKREIEMTASGEFTSDLICPRCGGSYLHHIGADFYERGEDQPQEVVISVIHGQTTTKIESAASTSNPSSRRNGMAIRFACEFCSDEHGLLELTIAQHKGMSEIGWRFDKQS